MEICYTYCATWRNKRAPAWPPRCRPCGCVGSIAAARRPRRRPAPSASGAAVHPRDPIVAAAADRMAEVAAVLPLSLPMTTIVPPASSPFPSPSLFLLPVDVAVVVLDAAAAAPPQRGALLLRPP